MISRCGKDYRGSAYYDNAMMVFSVKIFISLINQLFVRSLSEGRSLCMYEGNTVTFD